MSVVDLSFLRGDLTWRELGLSVACNDRSDRVGKEEVLRTMLRNQGKDERREGFKEAPGFTSSFSKRNSSQTIYRKVTGTHMHQSTSKELAYYLLISRMENRKTNFGGHFPRATPSAAGESYLKSLPYKSPKN